MESSGQTQRRFDPLTFALGLFTFLILCVYVPVAIFADATPWGSSEPGRFGERWPDGTITVFDGSQRPITTQYALTKWNEIGLPVRFILTHDREQADVVIIANSKLLSEWCSQTKCRGAALVGYRRNRQTQLRLQSPTEPKEHTVNRYHLITIQHELGHILGLKHQDSGCRIMNADGGLFHCAPLEQGNHWLCGPSERDVLEALALYESRGNPRYNPWCRY